MKYFPPEDWVTVNIQFSKPLYIMLKSQKFIPPPSFPPRDLSASEREAYHLGIKLTCAFEILCSASSAWGQKVLEVRNIEKQRKVCDSEIQSWDENQEEPGDEEWMTLSTADVRRIMGEDKSEEEQVKEMIANLEKFMEGESGFEGIDDEYSLPVSELMVDSWILIGMMMRFLERVGTQVDEIPREVNSHEIDFTLPGI